MNAVERFMEWVADRGAFYILGVTLVVELVTLCVVVVQAVLP